MVSPSSRVNLSIADSVMALPFERVADDHNSPAAVEPDTRPVVLQIVPTLDTGGAERTTIDIAKALKAQGWSALVASRGGRLAYELKENGGELIRMDAASKDLRTIFANVARFTQLIRERNIALIHARSRAPAWSALFAARRMGIPFVTTYHGIYAAKNPLKRWYNSVMARGDAVIANSQWTADHIRAAYPRRAKRLVVIPRGIDLGTFNPKTVTPERIAKLRAQWHAKPGDRVILLPGRLSRWKGQLVLLKALDLLQKSDRLPERLRAVIAGDAQGREHYAEELTTAIASHDLHGVAQIESHVDDMAAAYCAADIVVSASTEPEAFGRVPPEAAAMGRPVIATDHGGTRETVLPGQSGLLVKAGDAAALADAISDLLARPPDELAAMGAKGRAHVLRDYTLEHMCERTLAVYRELLASKP